MARSAANPFAALTEYELRNLVAHLEAAGVTQQLHRVLELATPSGRNGWYEAQLTIDNSDGYAADVARAWRLAEAAADVGLEVRYALITSTLNSHAENVPTELAIAALKNGLWTGRRTLARVVQLQDAAARAIALADITPHVGPELLDEVVEKLLEALGDAAQEGTVTAEVVSAVPEELAESVPVELLRIAESPAAERTDEQPPGADAIARARKSKPKAKRVALLAELAQRCPEPLSHELRSEAVDAARATRTHQGRAAILAAVAARLPASEREPVIDDALAAAQDDEMAATGVIATLAPQLTERQIDVAIALARKLDLRGDAFAALWPYLPERHRRPVLIGRLAAARKEDHAAFRVDAFADLLPLLSPAAKRRSAREALEAARTLGRGEFAAGHYARLAPQLPAELLPEALADTQKIDDRAPRALMLLALARLTNDPLDADAMRDALDAAAAPPNHTDRVALLRELAPYLPPELLQQALTMVEKSSRHDDAGVDDAIVGALQALAPHLPESLLPLALDMALSVDYLERRAPALAALGPYLSPELLARAVESVNEMPPGGHTDGRHGGGRHYGVDVLATLAPYLPEPSRAAALELALTTARETTWASDRAASLADLVPSQPAAVQADVVRDALSAVRKAGKPDHVSATVPDDQLAQILATLARNMPETVQEDVLRAALKLRGPIPRVTVLLAFVPRASGALRDQALDKALAAARRVDVASMGDAFVKASMLVAVAELLPEGDRREVVLEAARLAEASEDPAYGFVYQRAAAIRVITAMPPSERQRIALSALADARSWPDGRPKGKTLLALAPYLPRAEQLAVLEEGLRLAEWDATAAPLRELSETVVRAAWPPALRALVSGSRPDLLGKLRQLAPLIQVAGGDAAGPATRDAVVAVTGWWP
jgi:hypothetical protein